VIRSVIMIKKTGKTGNVFVLKQDFVKKKIKLIQTLLDIR